MRTDIVGFSAGTRAEEKTPLCVSVTGHHEGNKFASNKDLGGLMKQK
jgi:hypothetical protein